MRKPLALLCTLALTFTLGCDGDDGDDGADDGTGGGDRTATIVGLTGDAAAGETVYTANCGLAACHGPDGSGSAAAPPLSDQVPGLSDTQVVQSMLDGVNPPSMPSQAHLSDQELADVLAYVNANFG